MLFTVTEPGSSAQGLWYAFLQNGHEFLTMGDLVKRLVAVSIAPP